MDPGGDKLIDTGKDKLIENHNNKDPDNKCDVKESTQIIDPIKNQSPSTNDQSNDNNKDPDNKCDIKESTQIIDPVENQNPSTNDQISDKKNLDNKCDIKESTQMIDPVKNQNPSTNDQSSVMDLAVINVEEIVSQQSLVIQPKDGQSGLIPSTNDQSSVMDIAVINVEGNVSQQSLVIQPKDGRSESSHDLMNAGGLKRKIEGLEDAEAENSSSSRQKKPNRKSSSQSHLKLPIWYNPKSVDALEVSNMPEFFSAEIAHLKNAKDYLIIRNSIVDLYSNNPYIYLSATDCRKKITGDVCAVLKIHSFLDVFGVINFNVKAESRPSLAHSTLSQWHTDSKTTSSSTIVECNSANTNVEDIEYLADWSEAMDRSLRRHIIASSGDWMAVTEGLSHEFGNLVNSEEANGPWKPTSEECLARFLSLALIPSSFLVENLDDKMQPKLSDIAISEAHRTRLQSSEITTRAARALGCSSAQQIISSTLRSCKEFPDESINSSGTDQIQTTVILATAAAAISAEAKSNSNMEEIRLKSLLNDYVTHRFAALEEKMKLIVDVDHMIDLERERLEVDRRDVQIQRAQLAFQTSSFYR